MLDQTLSPTLNATTLDHTLIHRPHQSTSSVPSHLHAHCAALSPNSLLHTQVGDTILSVHGQEVFHPAEDDGLDSDLDNLDFARHLLREPAEEVRVRARSSALRSCARVALAAHEGSSFETRSPLSFHSLTSASLTHHLSTTSHPHLHTLSTANACVQVELTIEKNSLRTEVLKRHAALRGTSLDKLGLVLVRLIDAANPVYTI